MPYWNSCIYVPANSASSVATVTGFIKVIKYAEEADVKGKKSIHCCQDTLQEQHIVYISVF